MSEVCLVFCFFCFLILQNLEDRGLESGDMELKMFSNQCIVKTFSLNVLLKFGG